MYKEKSHSRKYLIKAPIKSNYRANEIAEHLSFLWCVLIRNLWMMIAQKYFNFNLLIITNAFKQMLLKAR